jgi:hypothetical protein
MYYKLLFIHRFFEFNFIRIVDIREFTSDPNLMKDSNFCFEIETIDKNTPVLRVGTDTAAEKESWLKAVTIARDSYILKKSTYKLQMRDLNQDDILRCARELVKHHTVYFSLVAEDREELVTAMGLDLTNVKMVSDYLYHEMMAMGLSEEYLTLLHELLLVPAGLESIWAALIASKNSCQFYGVIILNVVLCIVLTLLLLYCIVLYCLLLLLDVKKLRKLTPAGIKDASKRMSTAAPNDLDSPLWSDQTVSALLNTKSTAGRGEYTQMR